MSRILSGFVCLLAFGLPRTSAQAFDEPYVWGVGPRVGTLFIPGRSPAAFPGAIDRYDWVDEGALAGDPSSDEPERDLDPTGAPRFTSLSRVGADARVGLDLVLGLDPVNRAGFGVGTALGSGYNDYWFTLNYDRVLQEGFLDFIGGFQAGFGYMRYQGDDDDESLSVPYFPLRARVGTQLLDHKRLLGLNLFTQLSVPSSTNYRDLDGVEQSLGSPLGFALYTAVGIEFEIKFGRFEPVKPMRSASLVR